MQVKQQDKADHNPDINNEIDTAADANQSRQPGCVIWQPDEIKSGRRDKNRHD